MRLIKKTDTPRPLKYRIYVHADKMNEYKEEAFFCPTCGHMINIEDMYINECEICRQKLDWGKI